MKFNSKYIIAVGLFMASAASMKAQELNSAYFTEDYKFRHDLNPAFGNEQNYISIPALGNLNVKMQGNFGLEDVLFKDPVSGKFNRTFMHPDVSTSEALKGFQDGKNRINADLRLTLLSFGFKGLGGYNTVEINERTSIGLYLPGDLFRFAKNVNNAVYNFDLGMRAVSFAEIALGHSHKINDDLRVGAKLKVLLGVGRADLKIEGLKAQLTGDKWTLSSGKVDAEVNVKGIKFENTVDEYNNGQPDEHIDLGETDIDGAGIGGFGLAVDLGAEYKIEAIEGLTVSAAVTDLGFINWSDRVKLKQKATSFTFDGFHELPVKKNDANGNPNQNTIDDQIDSYEDQISDFINLTKDSEGGSSSTMLAATVNVGAEYKLPMYKKLSFGLLGQHHFAGEYSWTEGRLSANWSPLKWLDGGVNVAINDFCTSAGWVLNIHPKVMNIFIGMDHILGKQSKEMVPLNSNANINIGLNVAF